MSETMQRLVTDLERRRAQILHMGGAEKIAKQEARGKRTARARLDQFFDDSCYFEVGIHGTQMGTHSPDKPPADAVVCAIGKVRGRFVCSAAYDFTVKGGSIGMTGETKVSRLRELSLRLGVPMVWWIDSAGARIDPGSTAHPDQISLFAGTGHLFREECIMSGVVPLVAAMVGPGAAGTAYIPGLADFVPMVKGIGSMALGGPLLVKAVTGQEITEQELGGSKLHCEVSGVGDVEVENDPAAVTMVQDYLSYMPQNCRDKPPVITCTDPVNRRAEELLDILPENPRQSYDMGKIVSAIVDNGHTLELKPKWARNIITCLARIGGYPCGIVANNPRHIGGILDVNASDKAAHFIQVCDAFNLPLVFLHDVPGFMVGQKVETEGIIRHGAKMLHVMATATVPKLSVVIRKSYGAGYYVMCGRAFEPDLFVAWPTAEIAVMGAEGMVGIAAKKIFAGQEPSAEARAQIVKSIQEHVDVLKVAGWGLCDDVIDPRDTRRVLAMGLELSWNKEVQRPWRKRGVIPV